MYSKVEQLLVEQDQTETEVAEVLTFYEDDFDRATLLAQLQLQSINQSPQLISYAGGRRYLYSI